MTRLLLFLIVALLAFPTSLGAQERSLLNVFPKSPAPGKSASLQFSRAYAESGSKWASGLDEREVFHASLKHKNNNLNSWEIRVAKGGAIYSFRGPFGESMPPQVHPQGEWIDEVTQIVAVDHSSIEREAIGNQHNEIQYFIHQAGDYQRDKFATGQFFFSPMLGEYYSAKDRSYTVVNWGQQAHIPSVHKANLLYYQKIRDMGDGIVEVTYLVHNFGTTRIDYMDVPWGSIRYSVLPNMYLSLRDGTFIKHNRGLWDKGDYRLNRLEETGGWAAFSQADQPTSYTLGIVFGQEKHWKEQQALKAAGKPYYHLENTYFQYGNTGLPGAPRDYLLADVITKCIVNPGENFFWRYYWVVGDLKAVTAKCAAMVDNVDYGPVVFGADDSPVVKYHVQKTEAEQTVLIPQAKLFQKPSVKLYAQPVQGAQPIFLMKNIKTGKLFISNDPYEICTKIPFVNPYPVGNPKHDKYENRVQYKPYDGKTQYIALLGYALAKVKVPASSVADFISLGEAVKDDFYVMNSVKELMAKK